MTRKEIKEMQEMDNQIAIELFRDFNNVVTLPLKPVRLRTCQAIVYETKEYYILQSYNTIVAFIIKEKDILVDVLRLVHGYSTTSVQHIAKFNNDYGKAKYGCIQRITYKPL